MHGGDHFRVFAVNPPDLGVPAQLPCCHAQSDQNARQKNPMPELDTGADAKTVQCHGMQYPKPLRV